MNRLMIVVLGVCAGVIVFSVLHQGVKQTRTAAALKQREWQAGREELAATEEKISLLRREVLDKKNRLRQATRHPGISPELLALLENSTFKGHSAAWAELRQQLGIGWDTSPNYVLVNKRVLKKLQYQRLSGECTSVTDEARDLLGLSPGEQSALGAALDRAREGQWLRIERTEPKGDIVAQYTVPAPDPVFDQSISNHFAAEVAAVVGPERADMLLPDAWRELRSGLAPAKPETMTIRRAMVDGEPDLICEMKRGDILSDSTSPVRYAHYPSAWFLTLFPGGWKALAEREGFELPQRFQTR